MSAPFYSKADKVSLLMGKVILALLPALAVSVFYFGIAPLIQLALAVCTALLAESAMLALRSRPVFFSLKDFSAILTAFLLALSMPPFAAWWLIVIATLFAIVLAKHLYGGLGNNIFNPAMVGFAVSIIAFPKELSKWGKPNISLTSFQQLSYIFTGKLHHIYEFDAINRATPRVDSAFDAISSATPLNLLKTNLSIGHENIASVMRLPEFGHIAGLGYEWIALAFLIGGIWLWRQKIIPWQTPCSLILGIVLLALPLWIYNPERYANPLFHLFSGATMIGAFFIVTDPVTCPTTEKGRLIFGFSVGLLIYIIRVFGGFPDAVAFSILIMNIAVPFIDQLTQPKVFGAKRGKLL